MNYLKASILRKKYIGIAEEEKTNMINRVPNKKLRPSSSIKSLSEVPSAHDLRYENPPLCIYDKPRMKQEVPIEKDGQTKNVTYRTILRNIEKEAKEIDSEFMKETFDEIKKRGKNIEREELEKVVNVTKKRVYKRPMTAVNEWKRRATGIRPAGYGIDEGVDESTDEPDHQIEKITEEKPKVEEEEVIVKHKITIDDVAPLNQDSSIKDLVRTDSEIKELNIKKRPKSKATARPRLLTAKSKFKVRVEREVEYTAAINCKNNKKLKLSTIVCPDEKTDKIKRLEKKLDFERPLIEKGLNPGSQRMLFPSRKTEQELRIFREIFVEPKEKELEKVKERAKQEREEFELKSYTFKTLKREPVKPVAIKNVDLNHSNMLNNSQHLLK